MSGMDQEWSTPISGYGEICGVERIQGMEDDRLSNHEVMDRDVLMEGQSYGGLMQCIVTLLHTGDRRDVGK